MTTKIFSELGLSPELLKAVDKIGFEQASPIQAATIPVLLQGRDVVGQSQTGSGKTAAFALPAIEKVDPLQREPQVLILCPTRELAVQVSEEVHKLAFFKRGVRALPIYGGQSYERQFSGLKQGAQIIIGTPGRLMDHMRRGTIRLETVKMVVLDEVDVMLDMGFRDDIEQILKDTPPSRQTVFFSATIPRAIQELIQKYSRDPQTIRMEQKALTVPTVDQIYYEVDRRFKIELLTRLIDVHDLKLGIIFCNTKRMVDDLVDHLNAQGYSADRLHGDMSQAMRDRVMNKFRRSGLEFLVATDVAARGIDVDDVEVVFNYDLPYDVEDYLHRIGRTGRAGKSGKAISFVGGREVFQIHNIERFTKVKIARGHAPTAGQVEEARANVFLEKARATLKSGEFKRQDHLIERLLDEGFSSTDIASVLLHHLQGGGAAPAPKSAAVGKPSPAAKPPVAKSPSRAMPPGKDASARRPYVPPLQADPSRVVPVPLASPPPGPAVVAPVAPVEAVHETNPVPLQAAPSATASAVEAVLETNPAPVEPTPPASASPTIEVATDRRSVPPVETAPRAAASAAPIEPVRERPNQFRSPRREEAPHRPPASFRRAAPPGERPRASFGFPPKTFAGRDAGGPSDDRARSTFGGPPKKFEPRERPSARPFSPQEPYPARSGPPRLPFRQPAPPPARLSPSTPRVRIAERPTSRPSPTQPATPPTTLVPAQPPRPSPSRPAPPSARPARREKLSRVALPRASRRPPANQTRLHINLGVAMGVTHGDIVGAIQGETGLPGSVVGAVDIRDRHLFVEVDSEHTNSILAKLNRTTIKGRSIKAKRVTLNPPPGTGAPPDSPPPAP